MFVHTVVNGIRLVRVILIRRVRLVKGVTSVILCKTNHLPVSVSANMSGPLTTAYTLIVYNHVFGPEPFRLRTVHAQPFRRAQAFMETKNSLPFYKIPGPQTVLNHWT
jgi:hypothetical protein